MKNTRSYRLAALLLAVVMVSALLPAVSVADSTFGLFTQGNRTFISDVTELASFTFASDGNIVGGVADLEPNKTSTMTISASDAGNRFAPVGGEMRVSLPEYVEISSEDAAACVSDDVTCSYRSSERKLVFKWKGEKKDSFTATLKISPDVPETLGLSGRHVITTVKDNKPVGAIKAQTRDNNRLVSTALEKYNGKLVFDDNNAYIWTFTHVTGDWYVLSCGGYLKMAGNALSLTNRENATIFHIRNGAGGYIIESNGYYLNIKSDNATNGAQGSNWPDMKQFVKLYSPSEVFTATDGNQGYIKLNANGGNAAISGDILSGEIGTKITLPDYNGTKSGKYEFIGWAAYSNIYENHGGTDNSYCEVYLPGTEYTVQAGMTPLYAVYNEKGTDVRFGFRKDGQIPVEPKNHDAKLYYGHVSIPGALKKGFWVVDVDGNKQVEGNHMVNRVTENLSILPSDEQIQAGVKDFDPETMYVHWYVLKYSGNMWKVDGVIRAKKSYAVGYDMNMVGTARSYIENMPNGFEFGQKATITVGAEMDGTVKTPSLEGYEFLGWNTEADGSGTSYEPGAMIEMTGSATFYAQWKEIPKYTVSFSVANATKNAELPAAMEMQENGLVTLPVMEERSDYLFSGWTVNGEAKAEGETFAMPAEDVTVEGMYYGPINVDIVSDWPDGKMGYSGATINLTAVLSGADGLDCTLQWQYLNADGAWTDVEGETGITTSYVLNEETSARVWRVIVTSAKPHQE